MSGPGRLIVIWIWLWNLFHRQVRRIPVTVHICDDLHGDDRITYYRVKRYRHAIVKGA